MLLLAHMGSTEASNEARMNKADGRSSAQRHLNPDINGQTERDLLAGDLSSREPLQSCVAELPYESAAFMNLTCLLNATAKRQSRA
jgi:hypothetical protein